MGKLIVGGGMISFRRLKDIREDNDLSQKEVSDIIGVGRSTYSLWELGINIIPLKYLCMYADYFNVSIDYVLGLTNDKNIKIAYKGINIKVLGSNMKKIRLKNNLSQESIGRILGVTQAAIARYENGNVCISLTMLYKFSKKFKVSLSSICGKTKSQHIKKEKIKV